MILGYLNPSLLRVLVFLMPSTLGQSSTSTSQDPVLLTYGAGLGATLTVLRHFLAIAHHLLHHHHTVYDIYTHMRWLLYT